MDYLHILEAEEQNVQQLYKMLLNHLFKTYMSSVPYSVIN